MTEKMRITLIIIAAIFILVTFFFIYPGVMRYQSVKFSRTFIRYDKLTGKVERPNNGKWKTIIIN